jgi:hypothetical protein
LSLVGDAIYTVLTQACGDTSGFYSVDVSDPHHPLMRQMLLSNTDTARIWRNHYRKKRADLWVERRRQIRPYRARLLKQCCGCLDA